MASGIAATVRLETNRGKARRCPAQRSQNKPIGHRVMSKIHFLHLGKTGGTALKEALKENAPDVVKHPHKTKLCDIPTGDKVFFLIREPCSRFVSGFYSRQRSGRPRRDVPWSKGERIAFDAYPTANSLAESLYTKY